MELNYQGNLVITKVIRLICLFCIIKDPYGLIVFLDKSDNEANSQFHFKYTSKV